MDLKRLTFAVAAAFAASAGAADASPFKGFYAGVQTGWARDRFKLSVTSSDGAGSMRQSDSGLSYAGVIGWDTQPGRGPLVLGLQADFGNRSGTIRNILVPDLDLKTLNSFGVSGRLGVSAGPRSLLYARGGYVRTRTRLSFDGVTEAGYDGGWQVAAGYEHAFSPRARLRIEVGRARLSSDRLAGEDAAELGFTRADSRLDRTQATLGLLLRF